MAGVELAGLGELAERAQVRAVLGGDERAELLGHERGEQRRADLPVAAAEPPPAGLAAGDDERPARREGAAQARQGRVAADVDDRVVAAAARGEVLARVVDDVVGAERPDQLRLGGAGHARHLGPERLRDLDRERADAARRADDEHVLAGLHAGLVAHRLQGGEPGHGDRCRLLERQVGRLGREPSRHGHGVLRERAVARAVDVVARGELGDVRADGLDGARHAAARVRGLGAAQAEARGADRVGEAGHDVPRAPVDAGRAHAHEDLAVADRRPGDLGEPQDVGGGAAVGVLDDRPHRACGGLGRRAVCRWVERGCRHGVLRASGLTL